MSNHDFDLGVIGGGAAGLTVTAGAAQLGAKTILFEQEPQLGGDCLHYGCVPSKTLIKTAKVYHQLQHMDGYGLPLVDRQPIDFKKVSRRIQDVIATIQKHDSVARFCSLGAKVIFGDARFTDEYTVEADGKRYTAAKWVIATGSSPAAPPVEGLADLSYLTNKEIFSMESLPDTLLIIGGGPIAIEMAQAFNRLGSKVEVIQRSGHILSKEDKDMAETIQNTLKAEGIIFHLNTSLVKAWEEKGRKYVTYQDATGRDITVHGDGLLVALGRAPNVNGLGLDSIDVAFDRRGVEVDDRLRTSQKHIFAAGDVTGKYQFTHAAGYEGGVVISNAIFRLPRKTNYAWLPWCTYTEPELASIGINEKAAKKASLEYAVWTEEFANNDRALAEGMPVGKIKLLLDAKEKPIGVQILGMHAGDLLSEWVGVLNGKVKLSTLASAIHPYPTLGEINKRVAGTFLSTKIFSNRVKRALAFFFNLKGRACDGETGKEIQLEDKP